MSALGVVVAVIGGLLLAFLLLLVALNVVSGWSVAKDEAVIRAEGRPVAAVLVMANTALLSGEARGAAGLGVIDLGPGAYAHIEGLKRFAQRAYQLYVQPIQLANELGPAETLVAKAIKDDVLELHRRVRVPPELCQGREQVYLVDLWLYRDRLGPDLGESNRVIPCMVTGREEGLIMQLPHKEAAARSVAKRVREGK